MIVTEYENAPNGEKGAILRREGLYSSHVIEWTGARDAAALTGATDTPIPVARPRKSAEQVELEKLRQNEKLRPDLAKTRIASDIMGKGHACALGRISEDEPHPLIIDRLCGRVRKSGAPVRRRATP